MRLKATMNIFKLLLVTLTMVLVVGCSNSSSTSTSNSHSNEATKKYTYEKKDTKAEVTLFYKKDSDDLLIEEYTITTKIPANKTKDEVVKDIENQYAKKSKVSGISIDITSTDNEVVVIQKVDYSKLNIDEAYTAGIKGIFQSDNKTASLSKVEYVLTRDDFKEVK